MKPLDPIELPLKGVQLIEASAGTGKTYTITTLFLRLLLERKLPVQEVVVVTFTKAATAELRARVRKRLREALHAFETGDTGDTALARLVERSTDRQADNKRLLEALQALDEASIFTIHGFCQRMLLEYAFESKLRFDIDLIGDQRSLIHQIVQDFWASEVSALGEAEVRFLQSERFDLKEMASLAFTAIQWPDMPLVDATGSFDCSATLERYLMLRGQAALLWRRTRGEVSELLLATTALNRRSYKPDALARWFDQLETLFSSESPSLLHYPQAVSRLSRSTLSDATKSGNATPEHRFFELCEWLEAAHQKAQEAFQGWLVEFKARLVSFARNQAKERKLERGLLSFDDLLQQMASALTGTRGEALARQIQKSYPAAMIDEFQDTDPIQYSVFARIFGKNNGSLFLIGDPKQAIYGFRGADIFAYLQAVADAGENTWTLDTNYRSDTSLVRALNALFTRPSQPFLLDGISYSEVKPRPDARDALRAPKSAAYAARPLEILFVERNKVGKSQRPIGRRWADDELQHWVAGDIARLLDSGTTLHGRPLKPSDIAVLTRTNVQAHQVGHALRALGIPSALVGDTSVFDSPEALEMRLILRAMSEPTNAGALRSALSTPSLGASAAELAELAESEQAWEAWVEAFRDLHELWERRGVIHALGSLLRRERVAARTLTLLDGERRLTNLRHLQELLHHAESELHLGMTGLSSWFDDVVYNPVAREGMAPDTQQIRLESDDFAVQLTTMHKSKGLEYPIVYCPYLWRDANLFPQETKHLKFHDQADQHKLKLDLRAADAKRSELAGAQREALAENLRLLYVAVTRAKHKTVLVWGAFSRAGESPLGYLLYQSPEPFGALSETPASRIAHMSDLQLIGELEQLEARSTSAITLRLLDGAPAPAYLRDADSAAPLAARTFTRQVDAAPRIGSFSQLTRVAHSTGHAAHVGKDLDEIPGAEAPIESVRDPRQQVLLSDFPRGARVGELLHSILEHSDFTDTESLRACTEQELSRHGLSTSEWTEPLTRALSEVLATPLPPSDGLTLALLTNGQRANEMEFTLPVRPPQAKALGATPPPVTAKRLAAVFAQYGAGFSDRYLARLELLGFAPLRGFLRGFIDLVFEHGGRYFVVDYKSNHLGSHADEYSPAKLEATLEQHHYYLQYHLYVTALHRYLAARLADYAYERHFGGVYYLFLRGMSPRHPTRTGIHWARPSEALIQGLSDVFEGSSEVDA